LLVLQNLSKSMQPMRILLMNQFFWPDAAPTGQLLGDVAAELVRRGHHVTVLTGSGSYAGESNHRSEGIRILRIPAFSFSRARGSRLLSWCSFLAGSALRSVALPRHDLVIALTTPPGLSVPAACIAKLWGARFWIWEMDLYPDVAVCLQEAHSDAAWVRAFSACIDWSRRRAEGILALGECMRERIVGHGIDPAKIMVAENWTSGTGRDPSPIRASGPLRVLYSGNLGLAHDVDTIFDVMHALRADDRFQFQFVGGGAGKRILERRCIDAGLRNTAFLPYGTASELESNLATADITLVTLKAEAAGTVVPSKLYMSFAAGRPVLFVGPARSEAARCLRRRSCGWQFGTGDAAGVIACLKDAIADRGLVADAGKRAYEAYNAHYNVAAGTDRIVRAVERISAAADVPALTGESVRG
jgi:colanic acid biosynthesis glycosyl transferase WcaI